MTLRIETTAMKIGRLAYGVGQRSDANPFKKGTQPYQDWRDGWIDMALLDAATCGADGEDVRK